jgi:hypothetical protein
MFSRHNVNCGIHDITFSEIETERLFYFARCEAFFFGVILFHFSLRTDCTRKHKKPTTDFTFGAGLKFSNAQTRSPSK